MVSSEDQLSLRSAMRSSGVGASCKGGGEGAIWVYVLDFGRCWQTFKVGLQYRIQPVLALEEAQIVKWHKEI